MADKQQNWIEQRDQAVAELETEHARAQIAALTKIRESWNSNDWGWDNVTSPGQNLGGMTRPHYGPRNLVRIQSNIHDRSDGRFVPFYETESDLSRIRAQARNLSTFTSIAVGAGQALSNYVMGGEWTYTAEARAEVEAPDGLLKAVQIFMDDWLEFNEWLADFDREFHDAVREDGETGIALYHTAQGMSRVIKIEPEQITEPAKTRMLDDWLDLDEPTSWRFGVHTRFNDRQTYEDVAKPLGYHVVFDNSGTSWEYFPTWPSIDFDDGDCRCMTHIKSNVSRNAKRGISDYWPIIADLEGEHKLARNTREGASIQAAIAYIIQGAAGVSKSAMETNLAANAVDSYTQIKSGGGTKTVQVERHDPGTVVRTGKEQQYHAGPMGTLRSGVFIEVAQFILRRIGIRWSMPEYMISGDASNSNFASTLISESPFVKARENDQRFFRRAFRRVMFKALKIAYDHGKFANWVNNWTQFRRLVEVAIEAPEVASRDPLKSAQTNALLFDKGILDAQTWATKANLDPEAVREPLAVGGGLGFGPETNNASELSALQAAMEHIETVDEARALLRDVYP